MERIRTFIAVPMTDEIKKLVGDLEQDLKLAAADVKWVEPENLHVTLKFLGNITQTDVEGLTDELARAVRGVPAFDVLLSGAGTFPPGHRPRVVWVGLTDGKDRLIDLGMRMEEACAALGFEKDERAFRPHLTIGRVRRGSGSLPELADRVGRIAFNPLKLRVDGVNLVRSRLSPQGPTYTILEGFALEH